MEGIWREQSESFLSYTPRLTLSDSFAFRVLICHLGSLTPSMDAYSFFKVLSQ